MTEYSEHIPAHKSALWTGGNGSLPRLIVELTERCNNSCVHCCINLPADNESARSRELPAEEFKRILQEAADLGCLEVVFTGGEPLLREDFEELYLFARRLGLKIQIFTNARLITTRLANLFVRTPPLLTIEVSVYGMKAESYDAVAQVNGAYAQYRCGIDLLLERNIPFAVSGILLPPTRSEMEGFEAWAATIPWMRRSPPYLTAFDLRTRRDNPEKNRRIQGIRNSPEDLLEVLNRRPQPGRRAWIQSRLERLRLPDHRLFHCGLNTGMSVDAYGYYHACTSLCAAEWTCDLRETSLRDAVKSLNSRIPEARAADPEYLRRCARCFIRPFCDQCPAKSWVEHGSLDTPVEYFCSAAHVQAQAWGLIRPEEKSWEVGDWNARIEKWGHTRPDQEEPHAK